jgi:hypothetical protein
VRCKQPCNLIVVGRAICCCRSSSRNLSCCSLIASSMLKRQLRLLPQPAYDEEPPIDRNSVELITPVNIKYIENKKISYSIIISILLKKIHKFISSIGLSSNRTHNFSVAGRRSSPIIVFSVIPNHLMPVNLLQYNMKVQHTCNI